MDVHSTYCLVPTITITIVLATIILLLLVLKKYIVVYRMLILRPSYGLVGDKKRSSELYKMLWNLEHLTRTGNRTEICSIHVHFVLTQET
jgi:hypothetical protein